MKELEWSQGFPHYNPIGAICCHGQGFTGRNILRLIRINH